MPTHKNHLENTKNITFFITFMTFGIFQFEGDFSENIFFIFF
jgi:hypothetical protein